MKALVLVGGYGTRLRPLTLSVPKPLIHFCNKSILEYQVASLKKAGVTHLILAVAYQPEAMVEALADLESKYSITITCSKEVEPLGTAGPIRLARRLLVSNCAGVYEDSGIGSTDLSKACTSASEAASDNGSTSDSTSNPNYFIVCNSDVICSFPLDVMLKLHRKNAAEGTILVTQVDEPSTFGVVLHDDNGLVTDFVEKPAKFVGNWINAGVYVLSHSAIDRIPSGPCSIEKEVFPKMAAAGRLYCHRLSGYWADIGRPQDFLSGMSLYLSEVRRRRDARVESIKDGLLPVCGVTAQTAERSLHSLLADPYVDDVSLFEGPQCNGNVVVDPSAEVGEGTVLGPNVTVDRDVVIGCGCRIKDCAIMRGVHIGDYTWINRSIVGWQSRIGKWVRLEGLTVVGENVQINSECCINGAFILPHKTITSSILESGAIIM